MFLMNRVEFFGILSKWKWLVFGVIVVFFGFMYMFGFNRFLMVCVGSGEEDMLSFVGL